MAQLDTRFNLDPARLNQSTDSSDLFLKGFAGLGSNFMDEVNKKRDYAAKLRALQDARDARATESEWRRTQAETQADQWAREQARADDQLALSKQRELWDEAHPPATQPSQWNEVPDPEHPGQTKLVGKTGGLYDKDAVAELAKARSRTPGTRPLAPTAATMVKDAGSALYNTTFSRATFKPEYGGHFWTGGDADMSMAQKGLPSFGTTPEQVSWWQSYRGYVSAIRKNKLYGAALSPEEQKSFDSFEVNPTMDPDLIQSNLDKQFEIVQEAATGVAGNLLAGGADPTAVEQQLRIKLDALGFKVTRDPKTNRVISIDEFPVVKGISDIGIGGIHGNEPTVDLGAIGG